MKFQKIILPAFLRWLVSQPDLLLAISLLRECIKISWDKEASKVVGKMDTIGIVILVVYLLFAITRRWIFSHWLEGHALGAFVLSISCGAIISRLWFIREKNRDVLKKAGRLPKKKA